MTRRRVIEAAVDRGWAKYDEDDSVISGCRESAARAYDLGRIAGLKEGARMAMNDDGWTPTIGGIKRKARFLLKRIRERK